MDTKTLDDTYFDGQLKHGDAKYIWSLESELSITLHNKYCLASYSISCDYAHIRLDTRNATTASKPNVTHVTTTLNDRNYSAHVLHTHSSLIISASAGTKYSLMCLY